MFANRATASSSSTGTGPFGGSGATRDGRLFATLKPICVDILANCRPGKTHSPQLASQLRRLNAVLADSMHVPALPSPLAPTCAIEVDAAAAPPRLGASLLHYVFFPVAQLFQASPRGPADLPDSTRREAFVCLRLLVEQWWAKWAAADDDAEGKKQMMWRQLLILSAVALTGGGGGGGAGDKTRPTAPSPSDSAETTLAIVQLLHALLVPRQSTTPAAPTAQWTEWDGEEELPSLDELDANVGEERLPSLNELDAKVAEEKLPSLEELDAKMASARIASPTPRLLYPTSAHRALCTDKAYRSPLLHALTACLDVVITDDARASSPLAADIKATALQVVRVIATEWVAPEDKLQLSSPSSSRRALAMTPILPGIVSRIVRFLTESSAATKRGGGGSPGLPGTLVARALTLLRDVCAVVMEDGATRGVRAGGGSHRGRGASVDVEGGREQKSTGAVADGGGHGGASQAAPPSLEDVVRAAAARAGDDDPSDVADFRSTSASDSQTTTGDDDPRDVFIPRSEANTHPVSSSSPPSPSPSLQATIKNTTLSIQAIHSVISTHHHPAAHQSAIRLATTLLLDCAQTLQWFEASTDDGNDPSAASPLSPRAHLSTLLLRWLLDLSIHDGDGGGSGGGGSGASASASTTDAAQSALNSVAPVWLAGIGAEVAACLEEIPKCIAAHKGVEVGILARRVTAALRVARHAGVERGGKMSADDDDDNRDSGITASASASVSAASTAITSRVERWGRRFIDEMRVSGSAGDDDGLRAASTSPSSFAPLELVHLDTRESRNVSMMLRECGRVCGAAQLVAVAAEAETSAASKTSKTSSASSRPPPPLALPRYFLDAAQRHRCLSLPSSVDSSTAALYLAREVTIGVAHEMSDSRLSLMPGQRGKRARKAARQLANELVRQVMDAWEAEQGEGGGGGDEEGGGQSASGEYERDTAKTLPHDVTAPREPSAPTTTTHAPRGLPSLSTRADLTARPDRFGPALNLSFVDAVAVGGDDVDVDARAKQPSALAFAHAARSTALVQRSLHLSLLALSAVMFGPRFRPHLLTTLYPVVSALAQAAVDGGVQDDGHVAAHSLTMMAHSAGYADLTSCVSENVDWILGEASWRLVSGLGRELEARVRGRGSVNTGADGETAMGGRYPRQSQSPGHYPHQGQAMMNTHYSRQDTLLHQDFSPTLPALPPPLLSSTSSPPIVLTQLMRLLGPSSLHLIEDCIDEVLDALDRFHGYADVCEALLSVLDRLLEVMRGGQKSGQDGNANGTGENKGNPDDDDDDDDDARQLQDFDQWLVGRHGGGGVSDGDDDKSGNLDGNGGKDDGEKASNEAKTKAKSKSKSQTEADNASNAKASNTTDATADDDAGADAPASSSSSQLITTILSKSLPFLSHPNPTIRARVLRMIGAATVLLCPVVSNDGSANSNSSDDSNSQDDEASTSAKPQPANTNTHAETKTNTKTTTNPQSATASTQRRQEDLLLPLLHRAWPLVLARLGWDAARRFPTAREQRTRSSSTSPSPPPNESVPWVRLEAIALCGVLARHVPQFMARRIATEAWPRMRALVAASGASGANTNATSTAASRTAKTRMLKGRRGVNGSQVATATATAASTSTSTTSTSSPLSQLLHAITAALAPLLTHQGAAFPSDTLWEIISHPLVLQAAAAESNDGKKEKAQTTTAAQAQAQAQALLKASAACDGGGSVWAVLAVGMRRTQRWQRVFSGDAAVVNWAALDPAAVFA